MLWHKLNFGVVVQIFPIIIFVTVHLLNFKIKTNVDHNLMSLEGKGI